MLKRLGIGWYWDTASTAEFVASFSSLTSIVLKIYVLIIKGFEVKEEFSKRKIKLLLTINVYHTLNFQ